MEGCYSDRRRAGNPRAAGDGLPDARPAKKSPQEVSSDAHVTYRCCLRGPDGVRELAPYVSWGDSSCMKGSGRTEEGQPEEAL